MAVSQIYGRTMVHRTCLVTACIAALATSACGSTSRGQKPPPASAAPATPPAPRGDLTGVTKLVGRCGLLKDGRIACWGTNFQEQFGTKEPIMRDYAAPVVGVSGVKDFVVMGNRMCAMTANGVVCWGGDDETQPVAISGTNDASLLAASANSACVVVGGQVRCWSESETRAVPIANVVGATDVAIHNTHACAAQRRGVTCWNQRRRSDHQNPTYPVQGITQSVKRLALTEQLGCALLEDGMVRCWALQPYDPVLPVVSTEFAALGKVTDLATVDHTMCLLRQSGELVCLDDRGCEESSPVRMQGPPGLRLGAHVVEGVGELDRMLGNQCGARGDGTVVCWSANKSKPCSFTAETIEHAHGAIAFDGDCALHSDGRVRCWGDNTFGHLGRRENRITTTPVKVKLPHPAIDLVAWDHHACVRTKTHGVWCWGEGDNGELGQGKEENAATPVRVQGLDSASAIAMAFNITCALQDRAVWCWGELSYKRHTLKPKRMDSSNMTSLFVDTRRAICGHKPDGRVHCLRPWVTFPDETATFSMGRMIGCGANAKGRVHCKRWSLGADNVSSATLDTPRDVVDISMHGHPCAVKRNGSVVCWRFDYNHLIVEDIVTIDGIDNAVEVATSSHGCARLRSGEVACFGMNGFGQVGDPTLVAHPKDAVKVKGVRNAVQVVVGEDFSCARLEDGSVVCWGRRGPRLGDGVAPGTGPVWVELKAH